MMERIRLWWKQKRCSHQFGKPHVRIGDNYGMYTPPTCIHCGKIREIPHDSVGQQVMHAMFLMNTKPPEDRQ